MNQLKFTSRQIPQIPAQIIQRERLFLQLQAGLKNYLTLVSAPAGYGKTVLVAHWLHSVNDPCAWLTVDEKEPDLQSYWMQIILALRYVYAQIGNETIEALYQNGQISIELILNELITEIEKLEHDVLLVLDDYFHIHAPVVHRSLRFLLEHCSANFHLILLTRSDPPLPLARYHARAQMVDIRAEDLKMNETEMAALLNGLGICALSGSALAMLYQRTEGWSAGIHLSNLAVRKQPDPEAFVAAFSGSQRYILTIFRTRFLKAFPCSSRNFCLKHPFCASLMGPSVRPCWIIRTLHFFWNNFTSRTTFCSRWMMSGSGAVIPIFFEMYCSTV